MPGKYSTPEEAQTRLIAHVHVDARLTAAADARKEN